MSDFLPMLAVTLGAAFLLLLVGSRYSARELGLMAVSLAAHWLSTWLLLWLAVEVYRRGDMLMYHDRSVQIVYQFAGDFWGTGRELAKMFFQVESALEIYQELPQSPTGTLIAISAVLHLVLGRSLYAVSFAIATFSWLGKVAMYEGLCGILGTAHRIRLLVASLLVPSVVFWSGGIVKEGVAMIGVGLVLLAAGRTRSRRAQRVVVAALGCVLVGLLKPHILLSGVVALGAWLYWRRSTDERGNVYIRPVYLIVGAAVTIGGMAMVGELFPDLSVDEIADEAATMQFYGSRTEGGSKYSIGDPTNRSIAGQLSYAPLALFTGLFRPLPFEVTNAQMAVNALECLGFLGLTAYVLWTRGVRGLARQLARQQFLVFAIVFTLTFATGVGLVSNTLGTLSRYRMPMVPFFATVLLLASAPAPSRGVVRASRPVVGRVPATEPLRRAG